MEFNLRPLTANDYDDILLGWWKEWGWEAPSREFLPSDGTGGIMVLDGDTPICAGFLYTTNSKVAWVDWIVSSKEYRKKPQRSQAIKLLVDTLTNVAKNTGHRYSYALIKSPNLVKTYEDLGYTKGDSYIGEMIKAL